MRASPLASSLLAFCVASGFALPAHAAFTRAPWVNDATDTTVTIAWEAGTAGGTQQVMWGVGAATDQTVDATAVSGSFYQVQLTGLSASTAYSYKVVSNADSSTPVTVTTAPSGAEPFRFVVYGDNRSDAAAHQKVVDGVLTRSPEFIVNTGDLSATGDYVEFDQIENEVIKNTPIFPAAGNHDGVGSSWIYGFNRNPAWYSFRWGNAMFFAISTEDSYSSGSAQLTWLDQGLAAAKADPTIDWIFAFHHYPVYSSSSHGSTSNEQTTLNALYKQYGVDAVFNGHDHDYERSELDNILYIVAGGGGAPLYGAGSNCPGHVFSQSVNSYVTVDIDGGVLDLKAWDDAGNMIDQRHLEKGPPSGSGTPTPAPTSTPGGGNPGGGNGDNGTIHGGAMCDVAGFGAPGALASVIALAGLGLVTARRRRAN